MPEDGKGARLSDLLRAGASKLASSETALIDARVLLKHATGFDDAGLIVHGEGSVTQDVAALYSRLLERRARGEPVAYITGVKEFWSLDFRVTPDVLIPRDDSECLIEEAVRLRDKQGAYSILDLGTGSGCLLAALLSEFQNATGAGVERSEKAAAVAAMNLDSLGLGDRGAIIVSDWTAALDRTFDIIIANPPYIREGDRAGLSRDVRDFEPATALFAGPDGFDAYEEILSFIPAILSTDGLLLIEAGDGQAARLHDMVSEALPGMETAIIRDLKGKERGVRANGKRPLKRD